ncbi:MAG: lysylphosphatidylglycerol synthase transmembrane domain-containing protein [Planctomycetota bacterium]
MLNSKIKVLLKSILVFVIIGFLVNYIVQHREQLQHLNRLEFRYLAGMYFLCLIQMVVTSVGMQRILSSLGVHIGFGEVFMLHNSTLLLNYVPMQFGTLFRARYLKKHFELSYTDYITFFIYLTVMMLFCSVFVGEFILIFVYGLETPRNLTVAIVFAVIILVCATALFFPLPALNRQTPLADWVNRLLAGRNQVSRDMKSFVICVLAMLAGYLFVAIRLWLLYHSLGQAVHPAAFFLLGSLGYIVIFLSITPGGLGIRELVLAYGAVILNVPFEVGAYATLIDRAVLITYAFLAGGICSFFLRRPTKRAKQQNRAQVSGDARRKDL